MDLDNFAFHLPSEMIQNRKDSFLTIRKYRNLLNYFENQRATVCYCHFLPKLHLFMSYVYLLVSTSISW